MRKIAGKQCRNLGHRTALHHHLKTRIAALVQPVTRRKEKQWAQCDAITYSPGLRLAPLGDAASGALHDLKRARDAADIGWRQACRDGRIIMLKRSIRLFDWYSAYLCTQFSRYLWNGSDAVKQGSDIQSAAANQYRRFACRMGVGDDLLGICCPACSRARRDAVKITK